MKLERKLRKALQQLDDLSALRDIHTTVTARIRRYTAFDGSLRTEQYRTRPSANPAPLIRLILISTWCMFLLLSLLPHKPFSVLVGFAGGIALGVMFGGVSFFVKRVLVKI